MNVGKNGFGLKKSFMENSPFIENSEKWKNLILAENLRNLKTSFIEYTEQFKVAKKNYLCLHINIKTFSTFFKKLCHQM